MTIAALQSVGAVANDRCNITGTASTRAALVGGQIDMYWEYTGTGWITHLKNASPIPESQAQYVAVRDADLAQNQIVWLPPSPFNNTYGLAVTQAFAQQNNLRTLTDWGNFINSGNPAASLCVEAEFAGRDDGLAGLLPDLRRHQPAVRSAAAEHPGHGRHLPGHGQRQPVQLR